MKASAILFRVFYSTSYTALFLLLITHIVLTPADAIYQSYKAGRLLDIFIVAGVYVLTALVCALLYASRLYTNRSVLKDIPKSFMPIEKEDLPGKRVRRLIVDSLARSVVIAYQALPRPKSPENESPSINGRISALMRADNKQEHDAEPTWGTVSHPGWSSPSSPDLPDLQYETVIKELTDLIEAKAVSLAPVDPHSTPSVDGTPMPDENVIEILQRPVEMGMRPYFSQLKALGVVQDTPLSRQFLSLYEQARFGPQPLTEQEFRALMSMFAEVLRTMTSLDEEAGEPVHGPSTPYQAQPPYRWNTDTHEHIFYIPRRGKPTFAFVGLLIMVPWTVLELQGSLIARVFAGRAQTPCRKEMRTWEAQALADCRTQCKAESALEKMFHSLQRGQLLHPMTGDAVIAYMDHLYNWITRSPVAQPSLTAGLSPPLFCPRIDWIRTKTAPVRNAVMTAQAGQNEADRRALSRVYHTLVDYDFNSMEAICHCSGENALYKTIFALDDQ